MSGKKRLLKFLNFENNFYVRFVAMLCLAAGMPVCYSSCPVWQGLGKT